MTDRTANANRPTVALATLDVAELAQSFANSFFDADTASDRLIDRAKEHDANIANAVVDTASYVVSRFEQKHNVTLDLAPLGGFLCYNAKTAGALDIAKSAVGSDMTWTAIMAAADIFYIQHRNRAADRKVLEKNPKRTAPGLLTDDEVDVIQRNANARKRVFIWTVGLIPFMDDVTAALAKETPETVVARQHKGWRDVFVPACAAYALEREGTATGAEIVSHVLATMKKNAANKAEKARDKEENKAKTEAEKAKRRAPSAAPDPRTVASSAVGTLLLALAELARQDDSVGEDRAAEIEAALNGWGVTVNGVLSDKDLALQRSGFRAEEKPQEQLPSAGESGASSEEQVDGSGGENSDTAPQPDADLADLLGGEAPKPDTAMAKAMSEAKPRKRKGKVNI